MKILRSDLSISLQLRAPEQDEIDESPRQLLLRVGKSSASPQKGEPLASADVKLAQDLDQDLCSVSVTHDNQISLNLGNPSWEAL